MAIAPVREVILRRSGQTAVVAGNYIAPEPLMQAFDLELAELGYVPSAKLRIAIAKLAPSQLAELKTWLLEALSAKWGANRKHVPLFRKFPDGIPADTGALWIRKVLSHFLQAPNQACLFCQRIGTTHVLRPCIHVVCDHCFDGSSYTACPVCEHHVDRHSPFFQPGEAGLPPLPKERVRFKVIDLCPDADAEALELLKQFCARKQALSPVDREDFQVLVRGCAQQVTAWLPAEIPVKESVALVFGALLQELGPADGLTLARPYIKTATDVLRLIAAYSGADPSLQCVVEFRPFKVSDPHGRFWGRIAQFLGVEDRRPGMRVVRLPIWIKRFKVARMGRPLRKALLGLLEQMHPDALTEDMLRHRSYWVWLGEFLHPHEYRKRFPNVARAFQVVRKQGPHGEPAPAFQTYYSKVEAALSSGKVGNAADLLKQRPGEYARRVDHLLRLAGKDPALTKQVLEHFTGFASKLSTPVLLTLNSHLPRRLAPAPVRIYWPREPIARGIVAKDHRNPLSADAVQPALEAVERELLRRFAEKGPIDTVLVDESLREVVVPFNERTASRSAIALPRGSRVSTPEGRNVRLFLHWCQPEGSATSCDLDLSVGLYDGQWNYVGVCSYYQLTCEGPHGVLARSAGDLRDAPFPDGAAEFVDVHLEPARKAGVRFLTMVVTNYAGLAFGELERAFSGLMFREDLSSKHFDPRTVELKFELQGGNGVFLPLVLDLETQRLHWIDCYSTGALLFNNVESANADIRKICPAMMAYFESGIRCSMFELALFHAAARARRVWVRGEKLRGFERHDAEKPWSFMQRIAKGTPDHVVERSYELKPAPELAFLMHGDVELPTQSHRYVLIPEMIHGNLAGGDLLT